MRVFWNGQEQVQEVSGGSGFCAQNQRRLHFGLGKDPRVEKVVIRWPSGQDADDRGPGDRDGSTRWRSRDEPADTAPSRRRRRRRSAAARRGRLLTLDNRYLAPILITCILLVGQLTYGILESYSRTLLAIASSIAMELVLARLFTGKWPHLASAYITGISVGILIRSPTSGPTRCAA